uniref:LRRCT domain-containing protein n=1 Tax=Salvator merianae TaxID=96440 RepID=A0A8D0BRG5_SALMN
SSAHNPLRALAPAAFAACARLRTLRLNGALLAAPPDELLGAGALANLSLLRLELAGNRLRALPPPRASLPAALDELDVRNNSLRALRAGELLGLDGLQRLQLAGNPLHCDCASLRPLLSWLRNGTARLPDRRNLRCASPAALRERPVLRLRPGQLDCLEGALETASYVFFGIVLALIGLVFLMVLYLNRKGIKRWLSNLREACRDQMEGYHYRYEQDSDPRRASPGGDL